jgi:septal ring factor EnvC (AmiA/AmiB activator)
VNHFRSIFSFGVCALLAASVSSCMPQTDNPEQLRLAHEQNAAMRKELTRMQQLIKQAGEPDATLPDTIHAREQELADSLNQLKQLKRQETEAKLRVIELQDRLDLFRSSFRMLQSETVLQYKRANRS